MNNVMVKRLFVLVLFENFFSVLLTFSLYREILFLHELNLKFSLNLWDNISSDFIFMVSNLIIVFLVALTVGALVRKKSFLLSILSNVIFVFVITLLFFRSVLQGTNEMIGNFSYQLYLFVWLFLIFFLSFWGSLLGQKIFNLYQFDVDNETDKITFFGIRWYHFIWLIFISYPLFLNLFGISLFAALLFFLTIFVEPAIVFPPTLIYIATFIKLGLVFFIFKISFWAVHIDLQFSQKEDNYLKKFMRVLFFGVILPFVGIILAYWSIASFSPIARMILNKKYIVSQLLSLLYIGGFIVVFFLFIYIYGVIEEKFSK